MRASSRLSPRIIALALALSCLWGCERAPRDPPPRESDGHVAAAAAYDACRARAAGDAVALVACADTVVAREADSERFADIGDAALTPGDAGMAARTAVADALARLALERAAVARGERLPSAATAPVDAGLSLAARPVLAATCVRAESAKACAGGQAALLPRFAARIASDEGEGAPTAAYRPPTCGEVRAEPGAQAALTSFEREFPRALLDPVLVERAALDDPELGAVAAYLACLAARTGFAPDVAESSLNLFASKTLGARARAALRRRGEATGPDGAAAREFAEQIDGYLDQSAD